MSGVPLCEASNYVVNLASKLDIQANNKLARTAGFVDWGVEDLAEACLEALQSIPHFGIDTGTFIQWYAARHKDAPVFVCTEEVEFLHALIDAAEDEGWDISEMAPQKFGDVEEMEGL